MGGGVANLTKQIHIYVVAIICFHNTVSMRKINHSMYFYPRSEPNQMHPRVCTSHTCLHLIKCIFHAIKTTTINGLIHMYIKKNLPCMNMLCFKPLCIWVYIDSSLAPKDLTVNTGRLKLFAWACIPVEQPPF